MAVRPSVLRRRAMLVGIVFFGIALLQWALTSIHRAKGDEGDALTVQLQGAGTQSSVAQRPTRQGLETKAPSGARAFDLARIVDPIRELIAHSTMRQIHHGIYKVTATLSDGHDITFAFKTECRPAAKWHGQQGWSEVGVYAFTQSFYGDDRSTLATAPPARGVLVTIDRALLASVVHKDKCGLVLPAEHDALAALFPAQMAAPLHGDQVLLAGVALTWQPRHDDNALPPLAMARWFRPPPAHQRGSNDASTTLSLADREVVDQISDVSVMDYLLANEDREEKNWFFDTNRRYVMMDNGWAFAGRQYQGSICSEERALLACPPILRHFESGRPTCTDVVNCRFRNKTVAHLQRFLAAWRNGEDAAWVAALGRDPLIAMLVHTYGDVNKRKGKRDADKTYNEALARYVQGCPTPVERGTLLRLLALGLERRMEALRQHVQTCVSHHGPTYVLGAA